MTRLVLSQHTFRGTLAPATTLTTTSESDFPKDIPLISFPGSIQTQMIPSQGQSTAKRKAGAMDLDSNMNPLLAAAAAKRAKKEKSLASNKRKLHTAEDAPGGLLVVRHTESESFSQPTTSTSRDTKPGPLRAASSQPVASNYNPLQTFKPPSKKFRADSQPPPSRPNASQPTSKPSSSQLFEFPLEEGNNSEADLERDVRAMEDEADHLRRHSRAHTSIDPALLSSNSSNSIFQFPASLTAKPSSNTNSKKVASRGNKSRPKPLAAMTVDTQMPIEENETPQIQRNKRLREGAMAAIANGNDEEDIQDDERGSYRRPTQQGGPDGPRTGHRRKSSISRGKRISTSFEATGAITQPHNSVSESSFYKHIDADLPEAERIRQLLIWCSLRSASTYNKPGTSSSTTAAASSSKTPSGSSTGSSLPPLSAKAAEVLKKAQDEFVRMLAEKRIDLSVHGHTPAENGVSGELKENEQNVRNRKWEVTYSNHIQSAQAEDEDWKKVSYEYDSYAKKLQASLEKRKKALQALDSGQPPETPHTPSSKSKGKGKATDPEEGGNTSAAPDDDAWLSRYPQPHELPPEFQRGADLARTLLTRDRQRRRRRHGGLSTATTDDARGTAGGGTDTFPPSSSSSSDLESELLSRIPTIEFNLDLLHTYANAARATTNVCERILDERYRILNKTLENRMRSVSVPPPPSSASHSQSHVLTSYIKRPPSPSRTLYPSSTIVSTSHSGVQRAHSVPPPPPPVPSTSSLPSPRALLRALTRVDAARPPAQVGDAARRAVREVQRVEESGMGAVAGERRVTIVPGMGVPSTPRRGAAVVPGTPGRRERTPGRERTPARER